MVFEMSRINEVFVMKWTSIILILVSFLLFLLRVYNRSIFRFDFEFFLFYLPSIIALLVYFYLRLSRGSIVVAK